MCRDFGGLLSFTRNVSITELCHQNIKMSCPTESNKLKYIWSLLDLPLFRGGYKMEGETMFVCFFTASIARPSLDAVFTERVIASPASFLLLFYIHC